MTELDQSDRFAHLRRTRRNLMAMAAIAGTALLTRTKRAAADADGDGDDTDDDETPGAQTCFIRGTRIETAAGSRKVEDLAVGDLVPTVFGGMQPIRWVGSYRYRRNDPGRPWAKIVRPVRIAPSALGPGSPHADLLVTQAHALYVDGALVEAGSLVNGTTITLDAAETVDELEFFHIKLDAHDVIFAEGAPCETLLTVDESANNFAHYVRHYGMPQGADRPCLPVLSYGGSGRRQIQSRLRSAMSPWLDRRHEIDIIRDRLEERGLALARGLQAVS
jgi:hypothetical protein